VTGVDIVAVPEAEKSDLWAMFQRYAAELAPHANAKPVDGVHPYAPFDLYWQEDRRWPFWAVVNGERAGFALVRFAAELDAMQMAEFYVVPACRRAGIGLGFARGLLLQYPGRWKIRQIATNKAAIAFWRKVVSGYAYTEASFPHKGIDRLEQTLVVA
jgi:predicted acetyltransferase